MQSPVVRVSVLGACSISLGRTRVRPDAAVLFALLLYLALRAGSRVTRPELLALLWSDDTEPAHRHALRQLLYRIRRAGLEFDVDGNELALDPRRITADVATLQAPGWADRVALGDIPHPSMVLPAYQAGLTPAYAEWVDSVRAAAASQIRVAALRHVATGRREGRWVDVETAARLCLATDPLNEEATLALAESAAMAGSKAEALRTLDAYLWELGDREKTIGLPAKLLRRRISEQPQFRMPRAGDPPLIARADELAWLNGHLDVAATGTTCSALLLGAPGVGKSAVARTFTAHAEMRGWRIAVSRLQPSDIERPMSVFVELIPSLLTAQGSLGAAPESIAQLRRLIEHRPDDDDILAGLSQEAEAVQARIRSSALDLLGAVSHEGPLVLLLEDLHWIDTQSLRLLAWLNEHATQFPILWLLTARMESRLASLREALPADRVPSCTLEALGAADAAALFTAYAPEAGEDAPVVQLAHAVAGGNPLFIREVAGHWLETGGGGRLPNNLRALMRRRVARLSASAQRVLHCCAILGRFATVPRVATVLGIATVELLTAIEELDGLGLLGLGGDAGSLVLHDVWQEEMVATMRPAARALLHLRSGEMLEAEVAESRLASMVSEAARHLVAAGARERALRLLEDAAVHQLDNGLAEDAIASIDQALLLVDTDADRLRLGTLRLEALRNIGGWRQIADTIGSVLHLSRVCGTHATEHTPFELLAIEAAMLADLALGEVIERTTRCSTSRFVDDLHRATAGRLGARAASNSFAADSLALFANQSQTLDRKNPDVRAQALSIDTVFHSDLGNIDVAIQSSSELVEIERRQGAVRKLIRALRYSTVPLRIKGEFGQAHEFALESYHLAAKHRLAEEAANGADVIASIMFEAGDLNAADSWLEQAEPWIRRMGSMYARESVNFTRAMIALDRGDVELAATFVPPAVPPAGRLHRPGLSALSIAVRVFALRGDRYATRSACARLRYGLTQAQQFRRTGYFVASLGIGTAATESANAAREAIAEFTNATRDAGLPMWRELAGYA